MDAASGADRHLDITFIRIAGVSILFREAFSHPYISVFFIISKLFLCY